MNNIKTTKEAAELLGISTSRVRQLIRAEKIKAIRLPAGIWIIEEEELKSFSLLTRKAGRPKSEGDGAIKK
tara:strand:- start:67 stop:279 length:213 start_codon:yes stop_codon:yes gene_type:complete